MSLINVDKKKDFGYKIKLGLDNIFPTNCYKFYHFPKITLNQTK